MAKYVYFDQSTLSRLGNANDPVTASVNTLSNHKDFVIVLSFEHIIESAALGEQKKSLYRNSLLLRRMFASSAIL